jgi:NAD+ synthase (glutamine-hydrolysing)
MCEDHFLEIDTFIHSEQSLASILNSDVTDGIICDIGCPILFNGVRYNCRVFCLDRKILLIRPKIFLADDGNYRERRFFTGWKESHGLLDFLLSDMLQKVTGQKIVKFGVAVLQTKETNIGCEMCEELWTSNSPHISQFLSGVELIGNGSGSHHQLRKLDSRLSLIQSATRKAGGVYLYANHQGCDGNRLYFDGSSLICVNGDIVKQASQFSMNDVEVITAIIDLNDIRAYRQGTASLQEQSSIPLQYPYPVIDIKEFSLCDQRLSTKDSIRSCVSSPIKPFLHTPEEECALGPACWLWDYLRRSGGSGYLLPLSGGADSASVATIVRVMCVTAISSARTGNEQVCRDIYRIMNLKTKPLFPKLSAIDATSDRDTSVMTTPDGVVTSSVTLVDEDGNEVVITAEDLCNSVLHTVYLGTQNSSQATLNRSSKLSESMGAYHCNIRFDTVVESLLQTFAVAVGGKRPRFVSEGGTNSEDLALQNIQARLRMVISYLFAQLYPWVRGRSGFLLVLGSANVDESLRGYMTKYDCSSADVNPIGGICKGDLKNMMIWASKAYGLYALDAIIHAVPTVS